MRAAIALALLLCFGTVQAGPTYQEKFAEYVGYGWPAADIAAGLTRWFGWNFEVVRFNDGVYVQLALRRSDGSYYQLDVLGKVE